jgi:hypothetical protein
VEAKMNKKIFFVLVMVIKLGTVYGQSFSTNENDITTSYVEHFSNIGFIAGKIVVNNGYLPLLYTLHDTDLAVLARDELRILRNTVYAKYGLIFSSRDLTEHFSKFNWYRPQNRNVDNRLTNADKSLIQSIQAFENAQPNNNLNARDLIGTWLGIFPVPAGWVNNIVINNNNTIEFGYNSMSLGAVFSSKGTYRIENGFLVVLITEQNISVGDYFHEGYASTSGGMESNKTGKIIFETPIRMVFPVGNIKSTYFGREIDARVRQIGSYDRVFGGNIGLY